MQPKSYLIAKWAVYALATLALAICQHLILDRISLGGITPFLYPMLCALVSSYEGLQQGGKFSLVMGILCDLTVRGPLVGFYTLTFTLIGVLSGRIGETLLTPGWLCGVVVSGVGMVLTNLGRLLIYFLAGDLRPLLMGHIALVESLMTLPMLFLALPLYRRIHNRCAVDY